MVKRINSWRNALATGKAVLDVGDGIEIMLPTSGDFGGEPGPPGAGVPEGGAALQVIRKNEAGTTTEWVTPDKTMVGLSNVNNTADADKPVSTAQAAELAGKASLVGGVVPETQIPARLAPATLQSSIRAASPVSILAGANLTVYGHSYATIPGSYITAGMEWSQQLTNAYNFTLVNHAVSGARMAEMATAAVGTAMPGKTGNRSYPAAKPGVVMIECEQNDILYGPYTTAGQTGFKHALRALIATVTAGSRIEASSATAVGAWSTLTLARFSGGSTLYSTGSVTDERSLDFTGVTSPAGYVYVLTLANAATSATGTLKVAVDGVDQGITYVGQGQMESFVSNAGGGTYDYFPAVIKVAVPTTGTHSVKVSRMIGSTIGTTYVDSLLIPAVNPPLVLVAQDPAVSSPPATVERGDLWNTYSPVFNGLISEVVAEFGPRVAVADLRPGWDSMTMAATGDAARFHPNDLGMTLIKDNFEKALAAQVRKIMAPAGVF